MMGTMTGVRKTRDQFIVRGPEREEISATPPAFDEIQASGKASTPTTLSRASFAGPNPGQRCGWA